MKISFLHLPRFQFPHLVFIESSCPAFLSKYSDGDVYVYTKAAYKFSQPGQRSLVISTSLMRYVKILCALLRFPCTFQGGFGVAYRLSKCNSIISDGILTEWLYNKGYNRPHKFVSLSDITPSLKVNDGMQLILGNNWYEFGSLSLQRNESYLRLLSTSYPNAYYYPHPKEDRKLLRDIFADKLIDATENIETYCVRNGIPRHLIGFLGSTAMASLGRLAESHITIEAIKFYPTDYDGPQGEITDPFLHKKRGIKITMSDLEETVAGLLKNVGTVSIIEKRLPIQ